MKDKREKLIDIGSTTALVAMEEIISIKEGRPSAGIIARQARALVKIVGPAGLEPALDAFCDELQAHFQAPGVPVGRRATARGKLA